MKRYLFAVIFSFSGLVTFAQHAQMDQQSFEEMVKTLEKPSRSSWQKPEFC
jgi:hypothetical protein